MSFGYLYSIGNCRTFLELGLYLGYKADMPKRPNLRACREFQASWIGIKSMKTLYLLRHAKSSWDNPELKDFERPLSERGLRDAPDMGKRFAEAGKAVGCIITSPAVRAKTTAKLFAEAIGFSSDDIASNPELYFAGSGMFLKAASLLDDDCESAMLVGHNPAITDFANLMANADIDNIPTAGLVSLQLPLDSWSDIEEGSAKLEEFDYPKNSS